MLVLILILKKESLYLVIELHILQKHVFFYEIYGIQSLDMQRCQDS